MAGKHGIPQIYKALESHILELLQDSELAELRVNVVCRTLTPEEALGSPERDDFPLQRGREKLMQAEIGSCKGQAFTDRPGNIEGTLNEILTLAPDNNFNRAVVISSLNAALRYKGKAEGTVHCRDEGPRLCARAMSDEIACRFGKPRIALVGLQPALAEALSAAFPLRILDLDPANTGKRFNSAVVEGGSYSLPEIEAWCDIFLVTGSTIINGTIDQFLTLEKPVIYFGTTIAGPAVLLGLDRLCLQAL